MIADVDACADYRRTRRGRFMARLSGSVTRRGVVSGAGQFTGYQRGRRGRDYEREHERHDASCHWP